LEDDMAEPKFYIPHPFQSRGCGVLIDPKKPHAAQVYFDVDGSARYLFAMSRGELQRLARTIERRLIEMPRARRRRKVQM
jgi:hypothetical protein